jgi:single-stranded DNA-binding protein
MMNVCTFVGDISRLEDFGSYAEIDIDVPEYYTNSRGEKKVDWTVVPCRAYSTAGEYLTKNARRGDHIAVRAMFKSNDYFRINEFKIIKD